MINYVIPGTTILITGATGSVGFEIARQATLSGAIVGVHGSREESVANTIARLKAVKADANLIAAPCDFHVQTSIAPMIDSFVAESGRLDALIHCAVTAAPGTQGFFVNTDPDAYGRNGELLLGTFQRLSHAALPYLVSAGGGTIVAFASDSGRFAAPRQAMLGSAFGGIMTFVRNVAMEIARDNVRIHCISPSYVKDTRVFEKFGTGGRGETAEKHAELGLPTPRDIAPLALFLCGPDATKMTGQIVSVNGALNA